MISWKINPIGTEYNPVDMIVDTVEQVYGVKLEADDKHIIVESGNMYLDGIVVNIFIHPESDCVWAIVKCNEVYFEVTFDGFVKYVPYYTHIKDSTELSGGVYW